MRRTKVLVAMVLTSSLVLIFFYSSLNLQVVHTQRAFTVSVPVIRQNVSSTTRAKQQNMTSSKPQSNVVPITISANFRKAVPQSSAYWNRRQNFLLKQLDARVNITDDERLGWSHCSAASVERLQTNIQDFNSYPALYRDFLLGMECRDPPILIDQPDKCTSEGREGQTYLLFAIKSVPRNFERRQAIRETWGQERVYEGGLRVRTVFLLGTSSTEDPDLGQLLSFEAQHFGDLLQWDFRESFYNLTLKDNAFLHWAMKHCSSAMFIFKGDDDVFTNTQAVLTYLLSLEPEKAKKLYVGHIVSQASPFRDAKNKYYVPQTFYEGAYPPYAGGGGFLFSGSLLQPLFRLSQFIPFFPIDDVYTGMCFQALGITPEAHKGFQTFDIREQDRENACAHRDLILVHQRSPQQTLRLWRGMHSHLLTC
ncbi:N-acetyllactosaminide beta-1,3-N-acetylglucosaminyltransferase 2 [Megalops cyprinoides]|uniref:N-acetyllactosaminide beta-1,3-N-acetylglucosaminyltransferase 2 n=1 Tax=Megalops cyprinoides TaxID=118141 RepID=UPI001864FACD|nr:N-acetyllactosaminide beta-1,3-N-acetylglucosaminyltransferase 2 [Megalops cyprinoides]XP_036392983.1 N-acetyllactosaminide beta-1,3-N-acetylglucosaminyltransferase 2 [Megalops cyprinoides]